MAYVYFANFCILCISIGNINELINKPTIALCVWVLNFSCSFSLQWNNEILGIQHIQNWEDFAPVHCCHVASLGGNGLHSCLHFRGYILLYHLLVTAEFRWVIATNALMEVRSIIFIECTRCKIEYTIRQSLVFQDCNIGCCGLLRCVALALWYKHIVVQVAFIHLPKVD